MNHVLEHGVKVCSEYEECTTRTWLPAFADCGSIGGLLIYHGADFVGHAVICVFPGGQQGLVDFVPVLSKS